MGNDYFDKGEIMAYTASSCPSRACVAPGLPFASGLQLQVETGNSTQGVLSTSAMVVRKDWPDGSMEKRVQLHARL
jgi:hypothetical protein